MTEQGINLWREIDGGFRGSVLLRAGAYASAVGVLVNLGAQVLAGDAGPSLLLTIIAWLLYILALWLLAGGFFWVGSHPFLSRFGFLVSFFHAGHGVFLLILLFRLTEAPFAPVSLTVGRLIATLLFVIVEREWLPPRVQRLLAVSAGLLLLKAAGRSLGYLPDLGNPATPLLDAVLMLFLAAALLQLATVIRAEEDHWAEKIYNSGHADFSDFNNPEHAWNKAAAKTRPKRKS